MIYLDYSATTMPNEEVLDSFVKSSQQFIGNPNSLHTLGVKANDLIEAATKQIADTFSVDKEEIIYTSGASESNNHAIKGIAEKFEKRGKHIITTQFEHSSIYGPIGYLQNKGYEVDFVKTNNDGKVNLEDLKNLVREDTILVTIGVVNSEIGIIQPIDEISNIIKEKNNKCFIHIDYTQAIGKMRVNFKNIDLASFSAHKFFGLKGIGILYKAKRITLEPLIHGGKSTTIYRSGTPALPLIVSTAKALRLSTKDLDYNYRKVSELNAFLREELGNINGVYINSPEDSLPYILNFSIPGIKPETFLHALEEKEVYISTQTACSSEKAISQSVYALTNDEEKSKSSLRVSISYITTKEELEKFVIIFKNCLENLKLK